MRQNYCENECVADQNGWAGGERFEPDCVSLDLCHLSHQMLSVA